jgi:hypothetical protein
LPGNGIASAFYCAIAGERVKRHFLISEASVVNRLPVSYILHGPDLEDVICCQKNFSKIQTYITVAGLSSFLVPNE